MALCLANPDEITVIAVKSAIYWYTSIINDIFHLEKPDKTLPLANWLSHQSFKLVIGGSNPLGSTKVRPLCSVRLRVRTPPFHGGDTGSNPVPSAKMLVISHIIAIFVK